MTFLQKSLVDFVQTLESWNITKQTVSSLVLLLAVFIFRWIVIITIRNWKAPSGDEKRRWILHIKNISFFILAAGLFGIWATELRAFAISLVAVAAALAIATKEMIQSFLGGIYISSARPFHLGDRIEVNGFRGEVIDHDLLSTTLLEIGPDKEMHSLSGRQLIIPNSLFLSHPVHNQSLQQEYVLQTLRFVVWPGEDWTQLERCLLQAAEKECRSYIEPAAHAMRRLAQREGLDLPKVDPRVTVHYDDDGRLIVSLRFPAPMGSVSRVNQAILRSVATERKMVPQVQA